MTKCHVAVSAICVVCLALLTNNLFGQASERGIITGVIRDSSNAVVPNARITVTNNATSVNVNVVSNTVGEFTVANLPPGPYYDGPGYAGMDGAAVHQPLGRQRHEHFLVPGTGND